MLEGLGQEASVSISFSVQAGGRIELSWRAAARPVSLPDPNAASLANIFDSHSHIDRIYRYWNKPNTSEPLKMLKRSFPDAFGSKFEGCIAVNCNPFFWKVCFN